jgi:hypothetical protein
MTTLDVRIRNRAGRRAVLIVVSAVCGLIAWAMLGPVPGHDLVVRLGPEAATQTVGPIAVAATALVAGLAGWAALALLERFTRHARVIWTALAIVVLAVSLLGPLNGVDATTKAALLGLHTVVGVVLIVGLPRTHGLSRN